MSKFVTLMDGKEVLIRSMEMQALKICEEELRAQFDAEQAILIKSMNRQIQLTAIISALQFEQESRHARSKN